MANEIIKKPRGTIDYYSSDKKIFDKVSSILLSESKKYGCEEVSLPIFEESKLFHRTVGESSDIVSKETFDLAKKGDKDYTLRPEFTASVSRMIIENKIYAQPDLPIKYSYLGSVFRYERPQTGRLRQFNQFGVEFIDSKIDLATTLDAFLLSLRSASKVLNHKIIAKLNFLGSFSSRENYKKELYSYFSPLVSNMCDDCKRRLDTNPLRILDCKVEEDQVIAKSAPKIKDFLNEDDKNEYESILKALDSLNIEYTIDDELVRGLDYYTGLVWELYDSENPTLGAIGGGGKYSSLMKEIGGPDFEGIGFSLGMERLLIALTEERKTELIDKDYLDYFIIDFSKDGFASFIADSLRNKEKSVSFSSYSKGMGGAFKMADRKNAKNVLIVEQDHRIQLKNMETREQKDVTLDELIDL